LPGVGRDQPGGLFRKFSHPYRHRFRLEAFLYYRLETGYSLLWISFLRKRAFESTSSCDGYGGGDFHRLDFHSLALYRENDSPTAFIYFKF